MSIPSLDHSVSAIVSRLRTAGCVFAEDEAEMIMSAAGDVAELEDMVERRVVGLPLEHVVGYAEFCGLRIQVDAEVFVPRRRTEALVRQAAELAPARAVVVDLCCGSGALGVALAAALDEVELYAADVDPAAVRCARRNVTPAGGEVYEGDLFEPLPAGLKGRVDVLLSNVPYVPTVEIELLPAEARDYEARVALDGVRTVWRSFGGSSPRRPSGWLRAVSCCSRRASGRPARPWPRSPPPVWSRGWPPTTSWTPP